MRIEKPKSSFLSARIVIFFAVVLFSVLFLFLVKSTKTKSVFSQSASESEVVESLIIPEENESLSDISTSESVNETVPPSTVIDAPASNLAPTIPSLPSEPIIKEEIKPAVIQPDPAVKKPVALLTSFYGDVKVLGSNGPSQTGKNRQILKGETIEVGASGEAVIEIEELYVLRLKPNTKLTQLEEARPSVFSGKERITYRFRLESGALLGTTKFRGDKINMLDLLVKDKVFNVQDSTFRVQLTDDAPWLGVLRGNIKSNVENVPSENPVVIHALEKVSLADKPLTNDAIKVSEEEWGLLQETYEMNMKTAAQEAKELDLSKKAGDFFENVFDHGTFYTEKAGYTVRDFYEEKSSGDVILQAEYDVFPSNSFVGLYVLTRDLDAKNYSGLRFDVRQKPDEGYPDRFYFEIKSKGQIVQRYEITGIKSNWESRQIDFFSPVSTPITEVTLVFLNESIGQSKKGYIQIRNVQMVPLTEDQKAESEAAKKNPTSFKGATKRGASNVPKSVNQAVLTQSLKAKKVLSDNHSASVPFKTDSSKKIAQEVPKIVSFDDLSQ